MDFRNGLVVRYTYLKGWQLQGHWFFHRRRDISIVGDISPRRGEELFLRARFSHQKYIRDFEVTPNGLLDEIYTLYAFPDFHFSWHRWFPLWKTRRSGWGLHARGDFLPRAHYEDFFYTYLGGLEGMRGYSYYSLGGTRSGMLKADLTLPLWRNINRKLLHLYPRHLFLEVYGAVGAAWTGRLQRRELLREVGGELRLQLTSWGVFPTAVTYSAAYGLDEFDNEEVTGKYHYGREWRHYLKILFNFEEIQREKRDHSVPLHFRP
jgi:hypothetical protein